MSYMPQFMYQIHFKSIEHPKYICRIQKIRKRLNHANVKKFGFFENFLLENGNFIKVKEYQKLVD